MAEREFQSFEEFWPFYVKEHQKKATRIFHFAGTTAVMACLAGAVLLRKRSLLLLAPVVGYGPAWFSHFLVEKNRPATLSHPLWSLRADLVMWSKMVRGEMDAEVERVLSAEAERHDAEQHEAPAEENGRADIPRESVN